MYINGNFLSKGLLSKLGDFLVEARAGLLL